MNANLFGTDGIRGVAGEFPLDENTLVKLGRVIGSRPLLPGSSSAVIPAHRERRLKITWPAAWASRAGSSPAE